MVKVGFYVFVFILSATLKRTYVVCCISIDLIPPLSRNLANINKSMLFMLKATFSWVYLQVYSQSVNPGNLVHL